MEHFALQGCCRLGQAEFSMETKNLYAVTAKETEVGDALIIINVHFPLYPLEYNFSWASLLCKVMMSPEGAVWGYPEPVQPSWLRCPSSVSLVLRAGQHRVGLRENSRAIRRRNGRISIPRGREPGGKGEEWEEGAGVKVKGCSRENAVAKISVIIPTAQNRPNALHNHSLYRKAFLCPSWRKCGVRAFLGLLSDVHFSCLLFCFGEILPLAANNDEGVGKRNPKKQKNPTSLEHLERHQLFEMSSWEKSLLHSTSTDLPSAQKTSEVSPAEMIQNVCRHRSCSYRHNEISCIGYIIRIIEHPGFRFTHKDRVQPGYIKCCLHNCLMSRILQRYGYSLVCLEFFSAGIWRHLLTVPIQFGG